MKDKTVKRWLEGRTFRCKWKTEFRDAHWDLYLCLVSVKLDLQRANAKRSQSIMTNPVLLPKTTSLQVIWVALFCNLSSSYLPLHTFKKEEVPPFSRRKGIFFSRWTSYSHGLSQTGKTWQIPDLCHRWKTERHGTTCCALSALSAVVWTDGIVSGWLWKDSSLFWLLLHVDIAAAVTKIAKLRERLLATRKWNLVWSVLWVQEVTSGCFLSQRWLVKGAWNENMAHLAQCIPS